jgi:hypothetical protein
MSKTDWKHVSSPSITHQGAFGSDYDELNVGSRVVCGYNPGREASGDDRTRWVAAWKFPWGLCNTWCKVPGYIPMHDTPVPVGRYSLLDDGWSRAGPTTGKHMGRAVTKFRIDKPSGSVHAYLATGHTTGHSGRTGENIAAISSTHFISSFWSVSNVAKRGESRHS